MVTAPATLDRWKPTIDPDDPKLYLNRDVIWFQPDMPGIGPEAWKDRLPWMVTGISQAKAIARTHPEQTIGVLAALASWRTCTVDQLRDGLSNTPLPEFTDEPNLYGALCRLGLIYVGVSDREYMFPGTVPHRWLCIRTNRDEAMRLLAGAGIPKDISRSWANSRATYTHRHARHNTYVAHLGLALARHPQVRWVGGDGWCRFNTIDPEGWADSHVSVVAGGDALCLCDNRALPVFEVQSSMAGLENKVGRWMRMLAASPMSRRGLMCVWLLIPGQRDHAYQDSGQLLGLIREQDESRRPDVAARIGIARWDQWFNPGGTPTQWLGVYRDANGTSRSIFDPRLADGVTPRLVNPLESVAEWGWRGMRAELASWWGFDPRQWAFPPSMRGGFEGFIGREALAARAAGR